MKNKEKYAKEIAEQAIQGQQFAFDKHSKRVVACSSIRCDDCLFHGVSSCSQKILEWANAEYKEPKQFTEREKMFIRILPNIKYIARDNYGIVCLFTDKPNKTEKIWLQPEGGYAYRIPNYMEIHFLDIRWEDEEPTSREEILGQEKDGD